jgi:hypothetical protein
MKMVGLVSAIAIILPIDMSAHAAEPRDGVYRAFDRCNVYADDHQWLNCIYGAAQPIRGELGLPQAPDTQINLVPVEGDPRLAKQPVPPPKASQPTKKTGFFSYLLGGNAIVESAKLKTYNFDKSGHFLVVLSNGEIWQQTADDRVLANWRGAPSQYAVSIQTGALGSFTLLVDGEDQAYKVQRAH